MGDFHRIIISDGGMGFDTSILEESQSIGLQNLTQRIQMMLGGTVSISSEDGKGTHVVVQLPISAAPMTEVS